MKSPAGIVAEMIHENWTMDPADPSDPNFVLNMGQHLFVGNEQNDLDFCVTCYDTGGVEQNAALNDEMSTVQVRCKAANYATGYFRLQKIRLALEGGPVYDNGIDRVDGVWVQAPVTHIGKDDSGHPLFTLNFRILHRPANAGYRRNY